MGKIYATISGHTKGQYFNSEQGQFCRPFQVDKIEKIEGAEGEEKEKAVREKIQDDRYMMVFSYRGPIMYTTLLMQDDRDIVPGLRLSGELYLEHDEDFDKSYYTLKIDKVDVLNKDRTASFTK